MASERWNSASLVTMILLAAMGPYVASGVRTEQLMIFVAVGWLLIRGQVPRRWPLAHVFLLAAWVGLLLVSMVGSIGGLGRGSTLSGIDALTTPILLLFVVFCLAQGEDRDRSLRVAQKVTVALLVANTALAVTMMNIDLTEIVRPLFWSSAEGTAVGDNAVKTGRFTGFFNTPLAAGIAYSVGVLALIHLHSAHHIRTLPAFMVGFLLVAGGLLAQTKVFLFLGLPGALLLLVVLNGVRLLSRTLLTVGTVFALFWLTVGRTEWWVRTGSVRLDMYLNAGDGRGDALWTLTAGRAGRGVAGREAGVSSIERTVLSESPLVGYGVSNHLGPLDTGYTELLARAGLIGTVFAAASLILFIAIWLSSRSRMDRARWWTAGIMMAMWLGASAGGPSITQNRAGTILLVNLVLLLALPVPPVRKGGPGAMPGRSTRPESGLFHAGT